MATTQGSNVRLPIEGPRQTEVLIVVPASLHNVALDGVRGLAIFLVLVFHFVNLFFPSGTTLAGKLVFSVASTGWIGVDLFFVLSGFLITGILRHARSKPHYFRNFFARRSLRIFPLYYVSLAVFFLCMPSFPDQGWYWSYLWNVRLGMQGWAHGGMLTHFWSLAVEEQFYLIWPLVVFTLADKGLFRFCLALLGLGLAARLLCFQVGLPAAAYTLMPCHVDALAAGAALTFLPTTLTSKQKRVALGVLFGMGFAILGLWGLDHGFYNTDFATVTFGISCVNLLFAAVIALVSRNATTSLTRVFSIRPLVWLGKYSYGIYVIHYPIACYLRDLWMPAGSPEPAAWLIAAACLATSAATVVAAWLSFNFFESRCLLLKRYFA